MLDSEQKEVKPLNAETPRHRGENLAKAFDFLRFISVSLGLYISALRGLFGCTLSRVLNSYDVEKEMRKSKRGKLNGWRIAAPLSPCRYQVNS
jgi:hypothetical protein